MSKGNSGGKLSFRAGVASPGKVSLGETIDDPRYLSFSFRYLVDKPLCAAPGSRPCGTCHTANCHSGVLTKTLELSSENIGYWFNIGKSRGFETLKRKTIKGKLKNREVPKSLAQELELDLGDFTAFTVFRYNCEFSGTRPARVIGYLREQTFYVLYIDPMGKMYEH